MKKYIILLFICAVSVSQSHDASILQYKLFLTQKEYDTTLQNMKRKGLFHCLSTFSSDDKRFEYAILAKQYTSIGNGIHKALYKQYPQLTNTKNGWNADKISSVAFEYIKRFVEVNIPLMIYYQTYNPYNKFPTSIQTHNNMDYIDSFFEKPNTEKATYFIPCMQMYDSKEYQDYLIRVINFIVCKNCNEHKNKTISNQTTAINKVTDIAKMQGFARCLVHYQPNNTKHNFNDGYDKMPSDIQQGYFLLAHFLSIYHHKYDQDNIGNEVDFYIKQTMSNILAHNKTMFYVIDCLKIYESPEYNAEVKRIVKKYCKECK